MNDLTCKVFAVRTEDGILYYGEVEEGNHTRWKGRGWPSYADAAAQAQRAAERIWLATLPMRMPGGQRRGYA